MWPLIGKMPYVTGSASSMKAGFPHHLLEGQVHAESNGTSARLALLANFLTATEWLSYPIAALEVGSLQIIPICSPDLLPSDKPELLEGDLGYLLMKAPATMGVGWFGGSLNFGTFSSLFTRGGPIAMRSSSSCFFS